MTRKNVFAQDSLNLDSLSKTPFSDKQNHRLKNTALPHEFEELYLLLPTNSIGFTTESMFKGYCIKFLKTGHHH